MCRDDNATRNALYSCACCVTIQPSRYFHFNEIAQLHLPAWCNFMEYQSTSFGNSPLNACSWCASVSIHQTIIFILASIRTNKMLIRYSLNLQINLRFCRDAGKSFRIKLTDFQMILWIQCSKQSSSHIQIKIYHLWQWHVLVRLWAN